MHLRQPFMDPEVQTALLLLQQKNDQAEQMKLLRISYYHQLRMN